MARPTFSHCRRRALLRGLTPALVALLLAGCGKLQARAEFKEGNAHYRGEHYREAIAAFQRGLELDPEATFVWRSVGLSALALFRPGAEGVENAQYATLAIESFEKYLVAFPDDRKVEDYLITVLINSERYDRALTLLESERQEHPGDPMVEQAIVTTLIKAQRLDGALARVRRPGQRPDPQLLYSIGVAAWSRAFNDPKLDAGARRAVVELGLDATKQALAIKPDYFDAMAYYNLLFREKAKLATDPIEAQEWYALAEEWMKKALLLREQQLKQEMAAGKTGG